MCKHVAAALYGVGARFDASPELLFRLRQVDETNLVARADAGLPLSKRTTNSKKVLVEGDLSELFGLDMDVAARKTPKRKPDKRRQPQPKAKPKAKAKAKAKPAPRPKTQKSRR
jgi:uncharacterized Zn finger protein